MTHQESFYWFGFWNFGISVQQYSGFHGFQGDSSDHNIDSVSKSNNTSKQYRSLLWLGSISLQSYVWFEILVK